MKPQSIIKNHISQEIAHSLLNSNIGKDKEVNSVVLCRKFLITIIDRSFENLVTKYSQDYSMQLPLWLLEIYDRVNKISTSESNNTASKIDKFTALSKELYNRIFVILGHKFADKIYSETAKQYMDELERADINILFLLSEKKASRK